MDRAVNEHEQWSWFYWELEVGCCYWYFDLCAVARSDSSLVMMGAALVMLADPIR